MARNKRTEDEGGEAQAGIGTRVAQQSGTRPAKPQMTGGASGSPEESQHTHPQLVPQATVTGTAIREDAPEGPKVKWFSVERGGPIMHRGSRGTLRAGKQINEANYDIASLRSQGILLREISEDDRFRGEGASP